MTSSASHAQQIITDPKNPYVIGTQFHVTERPNGGGAIDIASIDSIVTTESDWQFNAAEMLVYVRKEKWTTINFDSRAARTTLKAAADSYLDLFGKPTPGPVPWGIPCEGLEGSVYTGNGSATDRCNVGIPKSCDVPPVSDRRYVIDETVGSVSVLCAKTSIMNYPPDSHEFRIENGKLQYVHAKTVMRNLTAARRSNSVR